MKISRIRLLIWKEFKQLGRDSLLLRVIFLMPLMQLVMFGYVIAADVTNVPTAVVDLDHSQTSRSISSALSANSYFKVIERPASEGELAELVDTSKVKVAIVIPERTEARLVSGETAPVSVIVDGADATTASLSGAYASQLLAQFNPKTAGLPGVDAKIRVFFNPTISTVITMIPGLVAVIVMLSLLVVLSQAVVKERESGTLEQMFTTPITQGEYLVGKVVPYMLLATGQSALVTIVGMWWFQVPFNGSVGAAVLGQFFFLLVCVAMGLMVSVVSSTRSQAQQMVMFIMIPSMVLCGLIFPIESMPEIVQPVSNLIPLTWALDVLRGTFVAGSGFGELWLSLVVLAGFAVALFTGAMVVVRRRLAE